MSRAIPFLFVLLTACPGGGDDTAVGSDEVAECEIAHEDGYTLDGLAIAGDTLEITVSYSGGCEEHEFQLCWDGAFMESDPVQARLTLGHDAHGDACEAYLTETLIFGLEPLKQAWIDSYGGSTGTIILELGDQSLAYDF